MLVLGIESGCDETSLAIIENGTKVIGELTHSQIIQHQAYGGVVPEIAAREHFLAFRNVLEKLLEQTNLNIKDIDRIAVVNGPGLVSSLLIGITAAKFLSLYFSKEIVSVNHLKAHICANYLDIPELSAPALGMTKADGIGPPFICLLASGGHTQLIYVKDYNQMELLGQTLDDSAGEAFDKVARMLGLNYPGGPEIEKIAKQYSIECSLSGRNKCQRERFNLPEKTKVKDFEFSYSGLKTAIFRAIQKEEKLRLEDKAELAFCFQEFIFNEMAEKLKKATQKYNCNKIAIAGGVSANKRLREIIKEKLLGIEFFAPNLKYCTDNGAMVGSAGYFCPESFGLDFSVFSRE